MTRERRVALPATIARRLLLRLVPGHRMVMHASAMLAISALSAAPPVSAQERVVIATFNAEWLFDGVNDNQQSPWRGRPTEATAHMQAVGNVIRAIDADIVNLVEVEDLAVLERLNADYLRGMGYTAYLIDGRDTYTGQDVGLLSRIEPETPLARTEERAGYPVPGSQINASYSGTSGVSKHYYTAFTVGGMRFALIGVHFIAFPDDRRRALQREAQAQVIRTIARREALAQGREVVILGDLNDYDNFPDAAGSQSISIVLALLRDPDPGEPGDELVNVGQRLDRPQRYSAWWDRDRDRMFEPDRGEATLIDHILVSTALAARVDSVWFYRDFAAGAVSDHWPLVVRLQVGAGGSVAGGGTALHTGIVASNAVGQVHPLAAGLPVYLRLSSGTYPLYSSALGSPPQPLDLRNWLGRLVSVQGRLEQGAIYAARLVPSP